MDEEISDIVNTWKVREEARSLTNIDYDMFFEVKFNDYLSAEGLKEQFELLTEMETGLKDMLEKGYSKGCIRFYSRIYNAVVDHDKRNEDGR